MKTKIIFLLLLASLGDSSSLSQGIILYNFNIQNLNVDGK
jgi:hypothetical protein